MLAVACQHMDDDRARIVYYQECASRCPEVKEKLDRFLGDALVSFDKLVQQDMQFPELQSVAEAGLAEPAWQQSGGTLSVLVARPSCMQVMLNPQRSFSRSRQAGNAKNDKGLVRLQKELKSSGKGNTALLKFLDFLVIAKPSLNHGGGGNLGCFWSQSCPVCTKISAGPPFHLTFMTLLPNIGTNCPETIPSTYMANSFDGLAALKREEALELATDLMVKDPAGMGNADVLFAANMSSLGDYSQALDANWDD